MSFQFTATDIQVVKESTRFLSRYKVNITGNVQMLQILIQFLVAPISAGVGLDLGIGVFQLVVMYHWIGCLIYSCTLKTLGVIYILNV